MKEEHLWTKRDQPKVTNKTLIRDRMNKIKHESI